MSFISSRTKSRTCSRRVAFLALLSCHYIGADRSLTHPLNCRTVTCRRDRCFGCATDEAPFFPFNDNVPTPLPAPRLHSSLFPDTFPERNGPAGRQYKLPITNFGADANRSVTSTLAALTSFQKARTDQVTKRKGSLYRTEHWNRLLRNCN
jgi:hypothetical protein